MKIFLVLSIFMVATTIHALEIDEKLTLRFLKVSNSKKTILINRGSEDGLVAGDHAKFYITSGVIARGMVEKVSPSRSIWSLYRVIDPAEIADGKVLNLKISSPVKITVDPSKSMKEDEVPAGTESMSMNAADEGATAGPSTQVSSEEQKELEGMGLEDGERPLKDENAPIKTPTKQKNVIMNATDDNSNYASTSSKDWEIWGTLHLNSLSGSRNDDGVKSDTSVTSTEFSVGLERYFSHTDLFKNLSIGLFAHKKVLGNETVTDDLLEIGAGASYHFYNSVTATNKLIGFVGFNAGAGNATVKVTNTEGQISNKWSTTFYSINLGGKYVFNNGFGVRMILDYYSLNEAFETSSFTISGPRFSVGLSYRF